MFTKTTTIHDRNHKQLLTLTLKQRRLNILLEIILKTNSLCFNLFNLRTNRFDKKIVEIIVYLITVSKIVFISYYFAMTV